MSFSKIRDKYQHSSLCSESNYWYYITLSLRRNNTISEIHITSSGFLFLQACSSSRPILHFLPEVPSVKKENTRHLSRNSLEK
jgi:hypothetical protein